MYQKLFSIEYNHKKFTIFMDKNNRKTFLELTKDNEYVYPKLDDFLYLNKIYNNNDFKFYSIKDFLFKEKVRIASSALAVIVSLNALPTAHALNFQVANNAVTISNSEVLPEVFISNSKDLDQVLNYKNVSKEEVSKTIDNNSKLTPLVKEALHRILDFITNSDSKADLRIFYENVKTFEANAYTTEEFKTVFNNTAGGAYDAIANKISYIKEAPKGILYHELWHATHVYYRQLDDKIVYNNDSRYTALNESLTDYFVSNLENVNSYDFTNKVLKYLLSITDFSYHEYNYEGPAALANKLKAENPTIDINYILEVMNAYNYTLINFGQIPPLDYMEEFREELFLLALNHIDLNSPDVYEPLKNYASIYEYAINKELLRPYLNKYNAKLKELGYQNIMEFESTDVFKNPVTVESENNPVTETEDYNQDFKNPVTAESENNPMTETDDYNQDFKNPVTVESEGNPMTETDDYDHNFKNPVTVESEGNPMTETDDYNQDFKNPVTVESEGNPMTETDDYDQDFKNPVTAESENNPVTETEDYDKNFKNPVTVESENNPVTETEDYNQDFKNPVTVESENNPVTETGDYDQDFKNPVTVESENNPVTETEDYNQDFKNPVTAESKNNPVTETGDYDQDFKNPVTVESENNPVTESDDIITIDNQKYPKTSLIGLSQNGRLKIIPVSNELPPIRKFIPLKIILDYYNIHDKNSSFTEKELIDFYLNYQEEHTISRGR